MQKEEKKIEEEKKEENKPTWIVGEVATQTQPILVNTETEENFDLYNAVAILLNKVEELSSYMMK